MLYSTLGLAIIVAFLSTGCVTDSTQNETQQTELYQTRLEVNDQKFELQDLKHHQKQLVLELATLEKRIDLIQSDWQTYQTQDTKKKSLLFQNQKDYKKKIRAVEESLDHLSELVWKLKYPVASPTSPQLKNSRDLVHAFNQERYQLVVRDADYLLSRPQIARSEVRYFFAESLYRLKRYTEALPAFQLMLSRDRDSARIAHFLMRISQIHQHQGREEEADQYREKLWQQHPISPEADHLRQQIKEKTGLENRS